MADCYKHAADFLLFNQDWLLVHAIVTGQGPIEGIRYGHAWVEKDNVAYDPVADMTVSADIYRLVGEATSIREYSYKSANEMMRMHGHYGPWDKAISAAVHSNKPVEINE